MRASARTGGVVAASRCTQESTGSHELRLPVDGATGRDSQTPGAGSTLGRVDTRQEIREFLTSRRARLTPDQVNLTSYGARRVPGLRREEVAVLAGVSIQYYTRLERGDISGVSEGVLDALAGALALDDAERAHLFDLARAAQPTRPRPRRRQAKQRVRPEVQWTLDAITGAAAFVSNERLDVLAANDLGRALYSELYEPPSRPVNTARFVFLDPRATTSFGDWESVANETVAILRTAAGRDPHNRGLSDLVGELATRSDAFRTRWATHNVRFHDTGVKRFHHPEVGELTLSYNRLDLAADHGLTIFTYTAEPGSRSEKSLRLLGSWAATLDPAEPAHTADT
jgi:transcriptional regulator with XRE-family HTH domain